MAFIDRKLETGILVLSVVLLGGLGYVLKTPVQNVVIAGQDFVYEMPRIKKSFLASLFDLGDREIERTYKNPFAKKQAAEKKKAEEAKKAQATAAAAKGAAKVAAKVEGKKPKVEFNVVEAVPAKTWGDDSAPNTAVYGGQNGGYAAAGGDGAVTDKADDKNAMSGDQWRALLSAQPTAENVAKLIQAFSKEEIDAASYYMIVEDLFKANRTETQELGLMAAQAFYNAQSFSLTVQYMEQFPDALQVKANTYLKTYGTSSRLGALAAVMKGSDVKAASLAINIALLGYKNAQSGTPLSGGDPRNGRGDSVTNSLSTYQQFRSVLASIAENHQDPTIANLANEALSQIPNSSTVASNLSPL